MKKYFCFAIVMFIVLLFAGTVFAADYNVIGVKTAWRIGYDKIYPINLPTGVDAPGVSQNVEEYSWTCDSAGKVIGKSKDIWYYKTQAVAELTKWNISNLTLSGSTTLNEMGIQNLNAFLYADSGNKKANIYFAYQYCTQQYIEGDYDPESDSWTCTLLPDFVCNEVEYVIGGTVLLSISPYSTVR
jgi:hypothetical protein